MTEKKKDTTPDFPGPGAYVRVKEGEKPEEEGLTVQISGKWVILSPADERGRKLVKVGTKKRWLADLFAGVDWRKGRVCKSCYSDMPVWSSREGILHCGYCGALKQGNTITPWEIPRSELKRLMEERVWAEEETVLQKQGGETRGRKEEGR